MNGDCKSVTVPTANDFEERIALDVDSLQDNIRSQLRSIHKSFYDSRTDLATSFQSKKITSDYYRKNVEKLFFEALKDIREMIGDENYVKVFKMLPEDATIILRWLMERN